MIDCHARYPADFRAEQVVGSQIDLLSKFGLLDPLLGGIPPVRHALIARRGRVIGGVAARHYGLTYEQLVARARACVPGQATVVVGKVVEIQTSFDQQSVVLANGGVVRGRLVVAATGLQRALLRSAGFHHRIIRDAHSLTFGFDLNAPHAAGLPEAILVYFGERLGDRLDYLTVFPIGATMRANLFTFHSLRDAWPHAFRKAPEAALMNAMPGLSRVLGRFHVAGPIQARVVDLTIVENPVRDGIVLIGDAYQTSCPAAGTGIGRLLTEIDCLCSTHIPAWLASPGMMTEKIGSFYADPRKLSADAQAQHAANYRRALATEDTINWALHRYQLHVRQRLGGLINGPGWLTTGVRPLQAMRIFTTTSPAAAALPLKPGSIAY
jgi:2-polyprenyl-6-methoxyphenol hydroxylase-like FAD-dependent oxidoreductase